MLRRSETDERILNKWCKKTTLNYSVKHLKEQPKQHLTAVWSGAQQTVVDEAIDEWRWRSGLVCPYKGMAFSAFIVISDVASPLLHFHVIWLNISSPLLFLVK